MMRLAAASNKRALLFVDDKTQLEDTIAVRARLKPRHVDKIQDLD